MIESAISSVNPRLRWKRTSKMSTARIRLLLSLMGLAPVCAGEPVESDRLQSECVREYLELGRSLADGQECTSFGFLDCERGEMASECINYCAFDVCQPRPCVVDGDCSSLGGGACRTYFVDQMGFGLWCSPPQNPTGGGGCDDACLDSCAVGASCLDICCR